MQWRATVTTLYLSLPPDQLCQCLTDRKQTMKNTNTNTQIHLACSPKRAQNEVHPDTDVM